MCVCPVQHCKVWLNVCLSSVMSHFMGLVLGGMRLATWNLEHRVDGWLVHLCVQPPPTGPSGCAVAVHLPLRPHACPTLHSLMTHFYVLSTGNLIMPSVGHTAQRKKIFTISCQRLKKHTNSQHY